MNPRTLLPAALFLAGSMLAGCTTHRHPVPDDPRWLTYHGGHGPGRGKHLVLVAAEQEYRSEHSLPMLARLLSARHGFDCTVLFALNPQGLVDPTQKTPPEENGGLHDIPGLEHLRAADLLILSTRFLTLPEDQLQCFLDYFDSGKPLLGIRTANHGFSGPFPYVVDGKPVRFGEDVLGGTFRAHHGGWHQEATRGIVVAAQKDHPILRGVDDLFGPSDVYRTYPEGQSLPEGCTALVLGQPLVGLRPDDPPNTAKEALPIAWTKTWTGNAGKTARVFHVTMGSAQDYQHAGVRRLTVNAVYWCLGLEDRIQATNQVDLVGPYEPLPSGFDYAKLGVVAKPPAAYR